MTTDAPPPGADGVLGEIGERRIFAEVLRPRYGDLPSYGDDCAAFGRDLVVTTDACSRAMVDSLGTPDWFHTGWLLVTMNLSDLAAAGAEPEGLVVAYTLPPDSPVSLLRRLVDGVNAAADRHGTRVRGGDMRDGPERHFSATAVGRCPRRMSRHGVVPGRLSRCGAREGDHLVLIGSPGTLWASAVLHRGHAVVSNEHRRRVFDHARMPIAQLEAGRMLARRGLACAAIDVSDGLHASVRLLCETNGVGARLHGQIDLDPVVADIAAQAGIDGFRLGQMWGDWTLLVCIRPRHVDRVLGALRSRGISAQDVGVLTGTPDELTVADAPWDGDGLDQERFSERSWNGDGIDRTIRRLRDLSG